MESYKSVQNHPEWSKLAKQYDDIKYTLITFGRSFSPKALKALQRNFKTVDRKITKLSQKLGDEGWME